MPKQNKKWTTKKNKGLLLQQRQCVKRQRQIKQNEWTLKSFIYL